MILCSRGATPARPKTPWRPSSWPCAEADGIELDAKLSSDGQVWSSTTRPWDRTNLSRASAGFHGSRAAPDGCRAAISISPSAASHPHPGRSVEGRWPAHLHQHRAHNLRFVTDMSCPEGGRRRGPRAREARGRGRAARAARGAPGAAAPRGGRAHRRPRRQRAAAPGGRRGAGPAPAVSWSNATS